MVTTTSIAQLCFKPPITFGEPPDSSQQVQGYPPVYTTAMAAVQLEPKPAASTATPSSPTGVSAAAPPATPTLPGQGHAAAEHKHEVLLEFSQHVQEAPRGRSASRTRRTLHHKDDLPLSNCRNLKSPARHAQAPRRGRRGAKPRTCSQRAAPAIDPQLAPVRRGGRPKPRREVATKIAEPLQSQWGLTARDAYACAKMFLREDIGLTCIFQLGLLSEARLVGLTKELSYIGVSTIKLAWKDLQNARFSFFPTAGSTFLNPIPV